MNYTYCLSRRELPYRRCPWVLPPNFCCCCVSKKQCVCAISYFLYRYMQPKGLWQRPLPLPLRTAAVTIFRPLSQSPSPHLRNLVGFYRGSLFGANGGSTVGLAMAGHPWILPHVACINYIKATSLVQLNQQPS